MRLWSSRVASHGEWNVDCSPPRHCIVVPNSTLYSVYNTGAVVLLLWCHYSCSSLLFFPCLSQRHTYAVCHCIWYYGMLFQLPILSQMCSSHFITACPILSQLRSSDNECVCAIDIQGGNGIVGRGERNGNCFTHQSYDIVHVAYSSSSTLVLSVSEDVIACCLLCSARRAAVFFLWHAGHYFLFEASSAAIMDVSAGVKVVLISCWRYQKLHCAAPATTENFGGVKLHNTPEMHRKLLFGTHCRSVPNLQHGFLSPQSITGLEDCNCNIW